MVVTSAHVRFSAQKQAVKTKKRSSRPQTVVCTETFQNFVEECCGMFSLFIMSKRRTFGNFLASSEVNFFFFFWSKRRTCPPKGGVPASANS